MAEFILLIVIGLVTGVIGGLLGIGGSIIMIPALTELLGPDQHLYQSAAMIVNFFVAVPAVLQHVKARAIDLSVVRRLMPFAAVAVLVGVALSNVSWFKGGGEARLRLLFACFLGAVSCYDVFRLLRGAGGSDPDAPVRPMRLRDAGVIAIPTGLIAGLLGVGGGIVAVPLQRRIMKIPIRQAIANSAATIIAISALGASFKNYTLVAQHGRSFWEPLQLALVLIPLAFFGASVGGRLTHRLPRRWVHLAFLVLMLIVAVRLGVRSLQDSKIL